MTDNTTDTFVSAMQTVLDMAPSAPDLPEIHEPVRNRRPVLAIASGFAVTIVAVGVAGVLLAQSNGAPSGAGMTPEEAAFAELEASAVAATECVEDLGLETEPPYYEQEYFTFNFTWRTGTDEQEAAAESCLLTVFESVNSVWMAAYGPEATPGVPPADPGYAPLDALPMIGTILQGWEIGMAAEEESADGGGLRTALYYKVVNDDTIFANLWIRGITEDSVYEGNYLMSDQTNLEELTIRGHEARMLTVDSNNFEFVWRDSPTAVVRLAINTEAAEESGRDLALVFADSLIDLTPEMWTDHLDRSGGVVPSIPTTTLAE